MPRDAACSSWAWLDGTGAPTIQLPVWLQSDCGGEELWVVELVELVRPKLTAVGPLRVGECDQEDSGYGCDDLPRPRTQVG